MNNEKVREREKKNKFRASFQYFNSLAFFSANDNNNFLSFFFVFSIDDDDVFFSLSPSLAQTHYDFISFKKKYQPTN